jgi:uncharacterized membrane protein
MFIPYKSTMNWIPLTILLISQELVTILFRKFLILPLKNGNNFAHALSHLILICFILSVINATNGTILDVWDWLKKMLKQWKNSFAPFVKKSRRKHNSDKFTMKVLLWICMILERWMDNGWILLFYLILNNY